jgi:hypothetical protein
MAGMFLGEAGDRRDPFANPLCADLPAVCDAGLHIPDEMVPARLQ